MINTVLFDLDGTLLRLSQDAFVSTYFGKLKKVFLKLGLDPDMAVKGVWAGTKAMAANDGFRLNIDCFWETFGQFMSLDKEIMKTVENSCDAFYTNEFDSVKSITEPTEIPKRLISALRAKGFTIVLATNPVFPECAVITRLNWLGLKPKDFEHITHYSNSSFCKPNPGYYREILRKINKEPGECIMVGNHAVEDMKAALLGIDTYLVTEFPECDENVDIRSFKHGTQSEMEEYLMSVSSGFHTVRTV